MDTFIQLTLNGLTLGSVYALIALGYSLVYGILKLLNFAHGDVFMVGSFIGFGALQLLGGSTDPVVPLWLLLDPDHAGRHGGLRRARRRDRAVRLPAATGCAAHRAADQRARRLLLHRLLDAAPLRRGAARLRRVLDRRRRALPRGLQHRQRPRAAATDHHHPLRVRPHDPALAARDPDADRQGDDRRPRTTGKRRR